jgi:hypothetical protein
MKGSSAFVKKQCIPWSTTQCRTSTPSLQFVCVVHVVSFSTVTVVSGPHALSTSQRSTLA